MRKQFHSPQEQKWHHTSLKLSSDGLYDKNKSTNELMAFYFPQEDAPIHTGDNGGPIITNYYKYTDTAGTVLTPDYVLDKQCLVHPSKFVFQPIPNATTANDHYAKAYAGGPSEGRTSTNTRVKLHDGTVVWSNNSGALQSDIDYISPLEYIMYNLKQPNVIAETNRPDKKKQSPIGANGLDQPWIDCSGVERKDNDQAARLLINDASHDWDDVYGKSAFAQGDGMVDNSRYRWAGSTYGFADKKAGRLDGDPTKAGSGPTFPAANNFATPTLRDDSVINEVKFKLHNAAKAGQYAWTTSSVADSKQATPMRAWMTTSNQKVYGKMIEFFSTRLGVGENSKLRSDERRALSEFNKFNSLKKSLTAQDYGKTLK
jgi:hypothetical protein